MILASASPRRRALLSAAGVAFEVEPSAADEEPTPGLAPEEVALELAERKARAVAALHAGEEAFVVGADTVVAVDLPGGEPLLLAKPEDERDAARMLGLLSGSRHRVVTGVSVRPTGRRGSAQGGWERTWVTMRAIAPHEVAAYVASGEWRDKAGGYAIQESADAFVTRLEEGGFDNVVGLPVERTLALLRRAGAALGGARR